MTNRSRELIVSAPTYDPSHIGIGIGACLASFFCCCCVRRCCCKKNASKKDGAETDAAAAEPAVVYREVNTLKLLHTLSVSEGVRE